MKKAIVIILAIFCCIPVLADDIISLSGEWQFALDTDKKGEGEKWFNKQLEDVIQLPGSLAENKKGSSSAGCKYSYIGQSWFRKNVEIPQGWVDKRITLKMERTRITKVWIDGKYAGMNDSLGTTQVYDLTEYLSPGSHCITIMSDNALKPYAEGGVQINFHKWNGILGEFALKATNKIWIDNVLVRPDVKNKAAIIKIYIGNVTRSAVSGQIKIQAAARQGNSKPIISQTAFKTYRDEYLVETNVAMGNDVLLWDEFSPNLYDLKVEMNAEVEGSNSSDTYKTYFGMRDFKVDGTQFSINGHKVFFRGKHDLGVNPIFDYPAMDSNSWIRMMKIAKSYGINHYRFHSSTPPKAAFEAADIVGIYIQPELYNFGNNIAEPAVRYYNMNEGLGILKEYGNSPSFVMFAVGNEMQKERWARAEVVRTWRNFDPSRLYSQASNYEFDKPLLAVGDDYWTIMRIGKTDKPVRGSYAHCNQPLGHIQTETPGTTCDYNDAIKNIPVPVIAHETGQYEVYFNYDEIKKYTGVMVPLGPMLSQDNLKKAGMFDQWKDFFKASAALQVICYREDIEAALRTKSLGGFQLLDLEDAGVPIGILDSFMDSKGYITTQQWRNFCSETVPLLRFEKYVWTNNEKFKGDIQLSHYGARPLEAAKILWQLKDTNSKILKEGNLAPKQVVNGLMDMGSIEFDLSTLSYPAKYIISIQLENSEYKNDYPIWVYAENLKVNIPANILVRREYTNAVANEIENGKCVLLMPTLDKMPNSIEGFWAMDFFSYGLFKKVAEDNNSPNNVGTFGLLCDPNHPVFKYFPTEFHSNWQWQALINNNSRCIILDQTDKAYRPILQTIDTFDRNHKLGDIFEGKLGKGKLLVCSIDLLSCQNLPQARQLLYSLIKYMESDEFKPNVELSREVLENIFIKESKTATKGI
jgi:hypothetical protein